ncbi:hypothetical protein [Bifidobacterium panos]|uniref:Uncharacterized protein n=1 Tax=Bifidobacterium panos TaxID=2675321 RepID=A0ABX1SZ84_9BIFI|nr:hypothetical protein [Bifidobacterium sp. DSM 109963]NMN02665.1 hypothetical protein [Bifidobacterium sp. DSM 109963]
MALRSLTESYTLPSAKLETLDYEASQRKLNEFMRGFKSRRLRGNPELQKEVGIILEHQATE